MVFPVMGSWISYGLGCETDELPSYVVLPDARGLPAGGTINWSNGFLPAQHQGVAFQTTGPAIHDLFPARKLSDVHEHASRDLLTQINRGHLETVGTEDALLARMRSYELAAKMQLAVPMVTELNQETAATRLDVRTGQRSHRRLRQPLSARTTTAGKRRAVCATVFRRFIRVAANQLGWS